MNQKRSLEYDFRKFVRVHALEQVSAAVKYPCAWPYRKDVLAHLDFLLATPDLAL